MLIKNTFFKPVASLTITALETISKLELLNPKSIVPHDIIGVNGEKKLISNHDELDKY
jgi:hypothetical protein